MRRDPSSAEQTVHDALDYLILYPRIVGRIAVVMKRPEKGVFFFLKSSDRNEFFQKNVSNLCIVFRDEGDPVTKAFDMFLFGKPLNCQVQDWIANGLKGTNGVKRANAVSVLSRSRLLNTVSITNLESRARAEFSLS